MKPRRHLNAGPRKPCAWLPAAPLLELLEGVDFGERHSSLKAKCERAQTTGRLTITVADELAVRLLGLHPCEVYGTAWWSA